jgi:hypothetical protein
MHSFSAQLYPFPGRGRWGGDIFENVTERNEQEDRS